MFHAIILIGSDTVIDWKKDTLFIVPSGKKLFYLRYFSHQDEFYPITYMTPQEVVHQFYFEVDHHGWVEASRYLKMNPANSSILLSYLPALEDRAYQSPKLNRLLALKKHLEDQKLLHIHPYFWDWVKKRQVVVADFPYLDDVTKKVIAELEKITTVLFYEEETVETHFQVHAYQTLEQEVDALMMELVALHRQGVPYTKMHLLNVSSEYQYPLLRLMKLYHIPTSYHLSSSLYGTVIGKKFLQLLDKGLSFSEILEQLQDLPYADLILSLVNHYAFYEGESRDLYSFLEWEMKHTSIPPFQSIDGVSVDSLYQTYDDDDYCFFLGFNQESVPRVQKDEGYLGCGELLELGFASIEENNAREREHLHMFLKSLPHLRISYKEYSPFQTFVPSSLISLFDMEVIPQKGTPQEKLYSALAGKLQYAKRLDLYRKFSVLDDGMLRYQRTFGDISYLAYQNQFTGIDPCRLRKVFTPQLLLSYSKLNQYEQCPFRYYASEVLKLDVYEETFATQVGSIFHEVLSKAFLPGFDFETAFMEAQKPYTFTVKDLFFLQKLKGELQFIIATIREQTAQSSFDHAYYEKKIYIAKDRDIKVTFMGIVDKILYQEKDGITYACIIDYKTGNPKANLQYVKYGLDMQLPIYLYLVSKSGLFQTVVFTGFYLQKILHSELSIKKGKDYQTLKKEQLKLTGYSADQEYLVEKIDVDYANSTVIQGMKLSKNGFYAHSKVLSEEAMEKLLQEVDWQIEEAITHILDGDFLIQPKVIDGINKGCEFCPFLDVCHRRSENFLYIHTEEGGEENAEVDDGTATGD